MVESQAAGQSRSRSPAWRAARNCQSGECAEVARHGEEILIRSSRSPDRVIQLTVAEWRAFERGMLAGEFTDLGQ
jgi:uncharacterized protein DUF397